MGSRRRRRTPTGATSTTCRPSTSPSPTGRRTRRNRGGIAAAVLPALADALDVRAERFDRRIWEFAIPLGDWELRFHVDLGATKAEPIACLYRIRRRDFRRFSPDTVVYPSERGQLSINRISSPFSHYGFGVMTTYDPETVEGIALAAQSLAGVCRHIADAAPGWVAGLGVTD